MGGGCLSPETLPLARRCLWEKRPETEGSFGDAPGPQGGNLPDQSLGRLTPTVCKRLFSLFASPSPDSVTDSEQGCSFILSNPGQSLISADVVYRWIKLEALLRPITRLRPPVVNITQFLFFFSCGDAHAYSNPADGLKFMNGDYDVMIGVCTMISQLWDHRVVLATLSKTVWRHLVLWQEWN